MEKEHTIQLRRQTDAEVLQKFRNPETKHQAFRELLSLYQQPLYWHIRKMVIVHEDADDLLQDVLVKVWNKLDTFRDESQLYTWLYRIATNECLNFLKKKKKRFFMPLSDYNSRLGNHLQTDELCNGDKIDQQLQLALLKLPDKQRLVFNMKYYDDMPYQQMSDILGTSVGALKASYHLATQKVKSFLQAQEGWEVDR